MKRKMKFAAAAVGILSGFGAAAGSCCGSPAEVKYGLNGISYCAKDSTIVVSYGATKLLEVANVGIAVDGKILPADVKKATVRPCAEPCSGSVAMSVYKKDAIDGKLNSSFIDFGDWGVRIAARADGVAYRIETRLPGKIRVTGETADVRLPADAKCSLCYSSGYGCEESVPLSCAADAIVTGKDKHRDFVYLPLVCGTKSAWIAVTESDVHDYPVWNLKRSGADAEGTVTLSADFAKFPKRTRQSNWGNSLGANGRGRNINVEEREDWLVETDGTRTFPWRVFVLSEKPSDFCAADIVSALARPEAKLDFSWVKPGKVAWDWWNAWDNKGEKDGCTTAGYKRFIDFAAKTGVEYVILDEGWSETLNIWKFAANVDVTEIIRYGNEKGVGIILWMAWAQIHGDEDRVAEHFAKLGAKGFKVDFMDRGDAEAERFLWKFADACARNRMVVDYHGAHHPTGMSRAYPNVLNYEGVHGLEQTKWYQGEDFPDNDVKQFFIRMTAGPMDYTPGAMDNYRVGKDTYKGTGVNPGSIGTRAHQMALMTAYEAPLQMLCDSPTKYERNMESFEFMAATPVVWADTVGLGGCPECYAAVARRAKDGTWHAAALNNSTAREIEIDTSFLGEGEWSAESFADAEDSAPATAYVHENDRTVKAGDKIKVRMAPGGGYAVRFTKR